MIHNKNVNCYIGSIFYSIYELTQQTRYQQSRFDIARRYNDIVATSNCIFTTPLFTSYQRD